MPVTFYKAHTLNVLNLGDMIATGLGAGVERQRLVLVGVAVALAGSSVAVSGGIGFIGLVGPHLARRLVGPNHRVMLPTAMPSRSWGPTARANPPSSKRSRASCGLARERLFSTAR